MAAGAAATPSTPAVTRKKQTWGQRDLGTTTRWGHRVVGDKNDKNKVSVQLIEAPAALLESAIDTAAASASAGLAVLDQKTKNFLREHVEMLNFHHLEHVGANNTVNTATDVGELKRKLLENKATAAAQAYNLVHDEMMRLLS